MTSELKCPFCGHNLGRKNINDRMCSNEKCVSWKGNFYGSEDLWQELIRTRKELEQSETCCSDWEKQALDYKAENINLSDKIGKLEAGLEKTRKALDVAVDALKEINMRCQNTVRNHLERATIRGELCDISFYARKAIDDIDNLEQITALEQKE